MTRKQLLLILVVPAALATSTFFWAFRSERGEYWGGSRGEVWFHYRWGRCWAITVDANGDGKVDARATEACEIGVAPEEYWEDRDSDGNFELHIDYRKGRPYLLEFDEDKDGKYDLELTGKAAEAFLGEFLAKPPHPGVVPIAVRPIAPE